MTMPDAWANINATASLLTGSDPICCTCDIRATVSAPRRTKISRSIPAWCPGAQICRSVRVRVQRACNSIGGEAAPAPFIVAVVIVCEENLSRGGLARLPDCAHVE
jgi:hypothetical protein